jgi:hypothetical protein
MKRHFGSFTARDDRGRIYELDIFKEFIRTSASGQPRDGYEETEIRTKSGRLVRQSRTGDPAGPREYEVIGTGLRLRSTDPNAPASDD